MEKQELFDNYILGKLSSNQMADFESKLANDADFALDFRHYLSEKKKNRIVSNSDMP